MSKYKEMF